MHVIQHGEGRPSPLCFHQDKHRTFQRCNDAKVKGLMLDTLAQICEVGGPLLGVDHSLFEGDRSFITAIALRFEKLTVVCRALPDDDTIEVAVGPLNADPGDTVRDVSDQWPWAGCRGRTVSWAWELTNQQGYTDGVRFEFSKPDEGCRAVELVVIGSAIKLYVAVVTPVADPGTASSGEL